jgi:16S rRNA (uracil1498-N3)-methyltransferase
MRANFRMQRLFVDAPLAAGGAVEATADQFNYLANVLRLPDGAEMLVFNGRDGEWKARLSFPTRKRILLVAEEQTRPQPDASDLHYLFAPLKVGRLDYLVQKAVEMGAGTPAARADAACSGQDHQSRQAAANAIEAAEQCGILGIPAVAEPVRLFDMLTAGRLSGGSSIATKAMPGRTRCRCSRRSKSASWRCSSDRRAGFPRRNACAAQPRFVTAIPLGPRILRADTAAVAAMAVIQAAIGDWV